MKIEGMHIFADLSRGIFSYFRPFLNLSSYVTMCDRKTKVGVNTGSSKVKAASTKNFKGNLNVTYKNSEWKSKITIKKVNSKKVSVKVVAGGLNQGSYNGTISSKNTINMKLDGGENIVLKWKSKTSFTAKKRKVVFLAKVFKWLDYCAIL